MPVSQFDCPPVTGESDFGQGDGGMPLDHCSKYIHGFGKAKDNGRRGGREVARPGTDLESLDDYRKRKAAELERQYHQGDKRRTDGQTYIVPGRRQVEKAAPYVEPQLPPPPEPKVEPLGDFPWWEQDVTQPIPLEVVERDWLGRVRAKK